MSLTEHVSTRTNKATRCRRCSIVIGFGDTCDWCQLRPTGHVDAPGDHMGRHHSEWIGTVRVLVEEDDTFWCVCGFDLPAPRADAVAVFGRHVGSAWIEIGRAHV